MTIGDNLVVDLLHLGNFMVRRLFNLTTFQLLKSLFCQVFMLSFCIFYYFAPSGLLLTRFLEPSSYVSDNLTTSHLLNFISKCFSNCPERCVVTFCCPVFRSLFTVLKNLYFHLQNKLCLHIFNF